jgi:hypothetical protein
MKAYTQIALPTGHFYELPTEVIAQHRAAAMQKLHPDEFATLDAALEDSRGLFAESHPDIRDWALNQMNQDEVLAHARLVRFTPPKQYLHEGEWSYSDMPAMSGEIDGANIMQHTVESVLSVMAVSQQLCNVTVLNGPDGKPHAAIALMIGNEKIIGAYLTALSFVGEQITGGATAPAVTH